MPLEVNASNMQRVLSQPGGKNMETKEKMFLVLSIVKALPTDRIEVGLLDVFCFASFLVVEAKPHLGCIGWCVN